MKYTHLSLFSGIGGLDFAAEMAGFETVGQCEYADYPYRVLCKHWPNVPKWRDIKTLNGDDFYAKTGMRTVDVVSGGFPCQPFSVAGQQRGYEDDRYLWPEMLRVIRDIKPRFVICENVPGILQIAGETVCEDLERAGYCVTVFNFEAAAVGASHRRERVFFVGCSEFMANADNGCGALRRNWQFSNVGLVEGIRKNHRGGASANVTGERWTAESRICGMANGFPSGMDGVVNFPTEPDIPRVAVGVAYRQERIKALGNAVVPQQAYPIFKAIMEVLTDE
jgi:DNA (cytosine-5)-methyltransferase 1